MSRESGGQAGEKKKGKEGRQEEDSRSISELGKRAKRRAKPFSISQRDCMGQRAAVLRCLLSPSGFYHCWGILAGRERGRERRRERKREREIPWLPPSAEATLCRPVLLFHLKARQREERDSHFKRQFDLRSTQERNLKEDLRKQLKGEYKGHTVTHTGQ